MVDEITRASLLYDFYGALLTEKQRQVMALYHEENLSLSEIGQEFGISRQAVHDTLKKAEQALEEYEEKLGLIDKFLRHGAGDRRDRRRDRPDGKTDIGGNRQRGCTRSGAEACARERDHRRPRRIEAAAGKPPSRP